MRLQTSHILHPKIKCVIEKHLKRIKKGTTGNPEDDEWKEIPTLGQKIDDQILEEVPDRSIKIERRERKNFEKYEEELPKLKDEFSNVAQYSKLVRKHVEDKKSDFKKFKKETELFDKQITQLKPEKPKPKFDLDKLNYKEIKVAKLKKELEFLKSERDSIKQKILHFTNHLEQAQSELNFRVEQIEDISLELKRLEKREILQHKIKNEEDALKTIKTELNFIGNVEQTKKIYGTVNTLVGLLKSKNQLTINELNSVKKEFNQLKEKYDKLMEELK